VAHVSVGEVGGGLGGAEVGRMDCAGRQGNVGPGRRRDSKFEIRKCAPRRVTGERRGCPSGEISGVAEEATRQARGAHEWSSGGHPLVRWNG
jgi:hypothetical protein